MVNKHKAACGVLGVTGIVAPLAMSTVGHRHSGNSSSNDNGGGSVGSSSSQYTNGANAPQVRIEGTKKRTKR
jgi:NADPH-dependent curcumin reductase CurA